MPAVNRQLEPGAVFHLMNRGVARGDVFREEFEYRYFLAVLEEVCKEFKCDLVAYCLMGNHYHLILRDNKCLLSHAMRALSLRYTKWFNAKNERDGPLFRGRFKSVRITNEGQLVTTLDYIHENPVKDGFVKDCEDWRWSSYSDYMHGSCGQFAPILCEVLGSSNFGNQVDIKTPELVVM